MSAFVEITVSGFSKSALGTVFIRILWALWLSVSRLLARATTGMNSFVRFDRAGIFREKKESLSPLFLSTLYLTIVGVRLRLPNFLLVSCSTASSGEDGELGSMLISVYSFPPDAALLPTLRIL